ncbi:uncharacterized protein LOC103459582 [Poecilia reticulata]|uniref:uncharacterized protein LOC103459582 n=1 Tax=Poecilia reticulata TaxID=8081 RepID=UPI0004A403D9|nr:PREDICTED: uncharacterized protein LOC103459582 [Poecilia reticulata]
MFLRSSLNCQPSTVGVFTDNILTNDQICEWIATTVSEFRYAREHGVFTNRTSEQHDSLPQPKTSTSPPTLVVSHPQASTSDKDNEHKQSSNLTVSQLGSLTVGQSPEEDGLRTTTKSSSEKKEHSQILSEVSSTHGKDEQNPVVNTPYSVETADESEHHLCIKRDLGGQTHHFYEEFSEESDEESDVEFEVVPVIMSDLNPELVDEEPALGKVMQHDGDHENQIHQHDVSARQSCAPKLVPASAFSKMAIFDTPDDQEQAIRCGQVSFVALPCGSPDSTSGQGEDSCPTEDSCSYSSGPECNYMTVSKELYKSISSTQRKTDHCIPENGKNVQMPPDDGIIDNLALDAEDNHCESEMKKRSQTSENSKQNDENVVIILSDSDEEGREIHNKAKMALTATSVDCGRGSRQERNTETPKVATLYKNQKSSRSRVSWQQSDNEEPTREVISVEAEDSDDFSNTGVNVLVPEKKKQRTVFSHPRRLSEAEVTKNDCIIDCMTVKESKSGEPATLVRVPRNPRQGPRESMSMAKSSFTERDRIRVQPDKPASIPTRTHVEAHRNSHRSIMHASPSPSSAMDHRFTPATFPSSSAPVQSMQVTSHARRKVFRTWKDQHVPLRREKKHKRANAFTHPR